jgi:rod shape-determining protein MreC
VKRKRGADVVILIVLCAIGALLGRLQSQARDQGRLDPFSSLTIRLVNPLAGGITRTVDATGDFFSGIFSAPSLRRDVRRLKANEASVALYAERIEQLTNENEELRKQEGLGRSPGLTRVVGDIVGYVARENRLTLNIGSSDGVAPGQAVVSSDGLLGVVSTVAPKSCQISLLGSANLIIGAVVARPTHAAGLLQGAGGNSMYIDFNDPKAEVKAGDIILTNGYSEKIPRGIRIGRVLTVDDIPEMGQRRATIFPSVTLGGVREVVVLK